ncbi:MAG: VWA domain-containing protein [Chloroflexi bacterium]|nr:VWA domain-containing protein [Chloroflexota bacterium]
MVTYRYSRWDGSQEVFALDADDLMDRLSEHLMRTGDLTSALRALMKGNLTDADGKPMGIESLLKRLREKRRDALKQFDPDSVVGDIGERLNEIERLEREGIAGRVQEVQDRLDAIQNGEMPGDGDEQSLVDVIERVAERSLQYLDEMPQDAAGKLDKLRDYEFMDAEANRRFQELLDSLSQKMAEHHFKGLTERLQGMDESSLGRMREMLRDLNRLLREKMDGEQPNFRQFKNKYADFFGPDSPETLDDLIEQMQRQAAQMESLLNSMSPEMRQQLRDLIDSVFQSEDMLDEMSELAQNLESLYPMRALRRDYPFSGDESLTLDEALNLMQQLQGLDALERQLKGAQSNANLSGVDSRLLHDLMGEEATQHLEGLKRAVQHLEDAGYISKTGSEYEITPRGMRRIGQTALAEIFSYIKRSNPGSHDTRFKGEGGEYSEDTKKYEFGDAFTPHLRKSLMNAVVRQASENTSGGGSLPIRLHPDDLEIYQPEQPYRASTVLMIDLSLSMVMRGNFVAAKKIALALSNLIRTRFPQDSLAVVGFSTYARELKPEDLPYLSWDEFDPYTNIQDGLVLAQRLLARRTGGTKQIIMVSDGEPTAHSEAGQLYLQYPPSPRTMTRTLEEVKRCASKGIIFNTFMLDCSPQLVEFVDKMTRVSRGRVFYTSPESLGQYIVVDYLSNRRRVIK